MKHIFSLYILQLNNCNMAHKRNMPMKQYYMKAFTIMTDSCYDLPVQAAGK